MEDVVCVILAAGKGKRMQQGETSQQKVLVEIQKKPMLGHVLEVVAAVGIKRVVIVIGHQGEEVEQYLTRWQKRLAIQIIKQEELLGTADAVKRTAPVLKDYQGDVLILYGDTPLLTEKTLRVLLSEHKVRANACTLLTTMVQNPTGYGRIVRNGQSESVQKIVEEVDVTPRERAVKEINVGVYCFRSPGLFEALKEVKPNNRKHEYYLTDTIAILSRKRGVIRSVLSVDQNEILGVNSPTDLARAQQAFENHQGLDKSSPSCSQ